MNSPAISISITGIDCDPDSYLNADIFSFSLTQLGPNATKNIFSSSPPSACGTYSFAIIGDMPNGISYSVLSTALTIGTTSSSVVETDTFQAKITNDNTPTITKTGSIEVVVSSCVI